jgi:hypothetical protein
MESSVRVGRWVVGAALVLAMGTACKPKVTPGLAVTVDVPGLAEKGGRATRIELLFDRPMVATPALGKDLDAAQSKNAPFRLSPEVAGRLVWREDRKLVFEPAEPLPRSTAFVLKIPAGTRALDGHGLVDDFSHPFETERLRVSAAPTRDWKLPAPETWATADQTITLDVNQPVRRVDLEKRCRFFAKDVGDVDAEIKTQEKDERAARTFTAHPRIALRLDTAWTFACEPTLTGSEGPLPIAEKSGPEVEAISGTTVFRTFGPFKVEALEPAGQELNPDTTQLVVRFSNPPVLPEGEAGAKLVTLDPAPPDVSSLHEMGAAGLGFRFRELPANKTITVKVDAGLKDVFGQTLGTPHETTVKIGSAEPRFDLETGSWAVESARGVYVGWTRNLTRLSIEAAAIPEDKLLALLPTLDWWDDEGVDLGALKIDSVRKDLDVKGPENQWRQVELDAKALLGPAAERTRFFYVAAHAPEIPEAKREDYPHSPALKEVLINVTDLGLLAKLSPGSGLVWVTSLSTGLPVEGADVVIRDREGGVRWRGRTGADGVAATPGRAVLTKSSGKARPVPEDEFEDEGMEEDFAGDGNVNLLIFARKGDDVTFVDPDRAGSFDAWSFNVEVDHAKSPERIRGFLHTDRGLYRPGDTVHLRGLLRRMRLGKGLALPDGKAVQISVRDPRGDVMLTRQVTLSPFGGFHFDVATGADARLGDYRVEASVEGQSFFESFSVEEYRPATFEVNARAAVPMVVAGETLNLEANGRYLYGAPVRGGDVTWRVHRRARTVSFPELPSFGFGDDRRWDEGYGPWGQEAFITEEAQKLDDEGRAQLQISLANESVPEPSELLISAAVQDETNQTVSGSLVVPAHPARFYLGLERGEGLVQAGKPYTTQLVAVSVRGKRIAARATVTVRKRSWTCAWQSWGYRGSYRCEKQESQVLQEKVAIDVETPAAITFTPPGPGLYFILAEGADRDGHKVAVANSLWAWGAGDPPWQVDDSGRFELVTDKTSYKIGDTARVLLKTPVAGTTAILTVEREGVLEHRVLPPLEEGKALEVPIVAGFEPNVFVSVALMRARTGAGGRGLPTMRMGVINLTVDDTKPKRLSVAVAPERPGYRPGETVNATIEVKDAQGKPVRAEVALAAADEGVLSLIGFKTPDPMATFFAPWGLGVRSSSQFERLAKVPEPGQARYATGGDAAGALGTLRSRFRATAYWNPAVVTDGGGRARVSFPAPDNLTAFRLMAVAADADDRFGSGDRRFTVSKPLQLISALPRLLRVGDKAELAVMLTNESDLSGGAKVDIKLDGLALEGPATRTVELAKTGRARVSFTARAERPGTARVQVTAAHGAETDGFELTFPVEYPTSLEADVVSQGETRATVTLPVALPAGVLPGSATLELSVDPDGMAGIEESLRELVRYPYGCLEQTTSRLIPLVAVKELAQGLGLAELEGPNLEKYVRVAIEKIGRYQTSEGGFGLWPGSEPDAYLTAYALWGLVLARDAGYQVDARRIDEGAQFLRGAITREGSLRPYHSEMGELGSRAFALYVLQLLDKPEPGSVESLLGKKDGLPRYGLAFLAQALSGGPSASPAQIAALVDELLGATRDEGRLASIAEKPQDLRWYMSSDTRTTAIGTMALIELRPDSPVIPKLVRGLLARRKRGSWESTQENLYALVALARYIKTRPPEPAAVTIKLGDRTMLAATLQGKGADRIRHVSVPVEPGSARSLTLEATKGTVHYFVRARYRRDRAHQPEVKQGFTLETAFLNPANGEALTRAKAGDMVRIRVNLGALEQRRHVALSNFLPAGFEPVNTRFKTTEIARPQGERDDVERQWWIRHRELHDDRVDVFAEWLWEGSRTFEYLARATTPGTFVVPASTVEEMYEPEVRARTAIQTFTITE